MLIADYSKNIVTFLLIFKKKMKRDLFIPGQVRSRPKQSNVGHAVWD
jgi:hypothetical protein